MVFEKISEESLACYEKYFFEEICKIPTGNRNSFSIPLPEYEGLHFACVQDTVERLIEEGGTGRLSKFQWRNFIFAPVDRNVSIKDEYERIFDELERSLPSIFIRSYVYLVFVRVYGSEALSFDNLLDDKDLKLSPNIFQIYQWNTNYTVVRTSPSRLAEIGRHPARRQKNDEDTNESDAIRRGKVPNVEQVFIVADPFAELQNIRDANSDVIDAAKAFMGDLGFAKQTAEMLQNIEAALKKPGSRVLLEGPARSGKTIIAMSLLAADPSSKMLLMNWYFYDALKDAFKIWAKQDESEIARLFEPSKRLQKEIARHKNDYDLLIIGKENPRILPALIEMWRNPPAFESLARWNKCDLGNGEEWLLAGCAGKKVNDIVYVWRQIDKCIELQVIDEFLDGGLARPKHGLSIRSPYNRRHFNLEANSNEEAGEWVDIPDRLEKLYSLVERDGFVETIASKIKAISKAFDESEQRFFHHDRNYQDGLWVNRDGIKLISENCTLICDEAQRLGKYGDLDECEWVRSRQGRTFLCGDDNQRLNRRGDRGIAPILDGLEFDEFHIPESVGIPAEIEELVKAMLCETATPIVPKSYTIKLLYKDDLGLVDAFNGDPSRKNTLQFP